MLNQIWPNSYLFMSPTIDGGVQATVTPRFALSMFACQPSHEKLIVLVMDLKGVFFYCQFILDKLDTI